MSNAKTTDSKREQNSTMPQELKSEQLANRQIRVFISSTFRDMQEERELLVKKVFPELRRICDERFVSFTEVDLRWGITAEDAAEGKVLPICLEEIRTCRPYFIGLLGERYGWIPDTVPQKVLEQEPWLQEHVGKRTSVTELEILHGVLRNPEMAGHTFFYFRDPAYIAALPEDEQREMVERNIPDDIKKLGPEEAARRTRHRKDRLAALKDTIRQSGLPLVDPYADPEALAAAVREQFIELIDKLYPKEQVPDPLDQEAIGHRSYARRKLLAYVDRPTHSQAIKAFVEAPATGKGLVVTGDSGGGKTALLAASTSSFLLHNSSFVFEHYFGATPDSANVDGFLHRLLGELKRLADIRDDMPTTPEKMREALPLWLAHTVGGKPIVLVLDGLNQIQGDEVDRRLNWLPRFFPAHVRVVASCLPGPALDVLRERGWMEHDIPLTDADERGRMIDAFLKSYRKELGKTLREQVVQATGSVNPLFLRTVLEELRQFGDFDHLPDKVAEYLSSPDLTCLFDKVLTRWHDDFGESGACSDLVRLTLCFISCSRFGMAESELLALLGNEGDPLPRRFWTPFYLAAENALTLRAGLLCFGHDHLRTAVARRWLTSEKVVNSFQHKLTDYFAGISEPTDRKLAELPTLLWDLKRTEELAELLANITVFLRLRSNQSRARDLYTLWWRLSKPSQKPQEGEPTPPVEAYRASLADFEREAVNRPALPLALFELGRFFFRRCELIEAEALLRRADKLAVSQNQPTAAEIQYVLACVLHGLGNYREATRIIRKVLKSDEATLGASHPTVARDCSRLAGLLGVTREAEAMRRRSLAINEAVYGRIHENVASDLGNIAAVLVESRRYEEAEVYIRRAISIDESLLPDDHEDIPPRLNTLARILQETGRLYEAENIFRRSVENIKKADGEEHASVAPALQNLAVLLKRSKRYAEAEGLYRQALSITEKSLGPKHLGMMNLLVNLAFLLKETGRLDEANSLIRRAVTISHEQMKGNKLPWHNKWEYFRGAFPYWLRSRVEPFRVFILLHVSSLAIATGTVCLLGYGVKLMNPSLTNMLLLGILHLILIPYVIYKQCRRQGVNVSDQPNWWAILMPFDWADRGWFHTCLQYTCVSYIFALGDFGSVTNAFCFFGAGWALNFSFSQLSKLLLRRKQRG
jgi:nephrocystin-3